MGDIRLGIIGVGGFGLFSMEQYCALPGLRITAIAGTRLEKYAALATEYGIPFHTTDWRTLATHPEVDAVYLATPPDTRAEMAMTALQAGKHVFCEKPLALTLDDADRMLATADRAGVRLGINFIMRYNRIYDTVRAITADGLLGAPQRFLFENAAGDLPAGHWFWDPSRSGGILVEHGVHFFDVFRTIFGPGRLQWAGLSRRESGEADRWFCVLRYADRLFGSFYHAFDHPSPIEHTWSRIECAQGSLSLDGWYPVRLSLFGLLDDAAATRLTDLLPGAAVQPLAEPRVVRADGRERTVSRRVDATLDIGDQQIAYAMAVRAAMRDFLAWINAPTHQPRVTAADGREALALALDATALARRPDAE